MTSRRLARGFTLIEVLLAIALSTVLLALLGTAINMHLLRVGASKDTVEQAQLARGVLRTIADDLRSVAVVIEQDISSAEATAAAQALFDVDETDAEPPGIEDQASDAASGSATDDDDQRPYAGVQGDAQSLQIDITRIRPAYVVSADTPDLPPRVGYDSPGINTVRYLLTTEGLIRQQAPRDRRIFEEAQGRDEIWQASSRVLAKEVAEIRFRYSDGEQVLDYWDLEEQQGALPATVQVTVGLRFDAGGEDQPAGAAGKIDYYTLTTPMPAPDEEASTTETDGATTGGGA